MVKMTGSLMALLALGGCANAPGQAPAPREQMAANSRVADDEQPMTGSRLKRKSTDRLLHTVGSQDARDALDSAPDPIRQGQ